MHEWMQTYLEQVRRQIRWKQAQGPALRELQAHLQDQYEACLKAGCSETASQTETLRQMGDPVVVGQDLDRIHRPRMPWEVLAAVACLLGIGLLLNVVVFYGNQTMWSLNHWLWTPICAMAIGVGIGAVLSHVDLNRAMGLTRYCGAAAILLAAVLVLTSRQGAPYHWSQYAAMLLPLAYGGAVYGLSHGVKNGFLPGAALLMLLMGVLLLSGKPWQSVSLGVSGAVILLTANRNGAFGAGKKRQTAAVLGGVGAYAAAVLVLSRARLAAMFSPISAGLAENFQRHYVLGLLSHSRPLGAGEPFALTEGMTVIAPGRMLADSVLSTDYLLASVSYLCGWTVAALLLAGVLVLLALLLRRGLQQKTLFGKLIACAVIAPMMVQTVGYVMANTGLPLGSFELPLLSYGGAYKVMDLALLGLFAGVIRSRSVLQDRFIHRQTLTPV